VFRAKSAKLLAPFLAVAPVLSVHAAQQSIDAANNMQVVMGFFIFVLVFVSQAKVGRKSEEGLTQMSALHALFGESKE